MEDFARRQGWTVRVADTRHLGFYRMEFLPDPLSQRADLAAVAGPLPPAGGRLVSGIYEKEEGGNVQMRFRGLRRRFSGYMHRAVLLQDVETADIRTMQVRPQWEKALGKALQEIRAGADAALISRNFCERLRKEGGRILWDPYRKEGNQ